MLRNCFYYDIFIEEKMPPTAPGVAHLKIPVVPGNQQVLCLTHGSGSVGKQSKQSKPVGVGIPAPALTLFEKGRVR